MGFFRVYDGRVQPSLIDLLGYQILYNHRKGTTEKDEKKSKSKTIFLIMWNNARRREEKPNIISKELEFLFQDFASKI